MIEELKRPNLLPTVIDAESLHDTFREDILEGLSTTPKATPAKHLYDARGSELFERICGLEAYYPTRTERAILDRHAGEIAAALGPDVTLIEPGAGSGEKAAMLLERMDRPRAFVPIEISRGALENASEMLADRFPEVTVQPICADFMSTLAISNRAEHGRRVLYFPGSTIGNLESQTRGRLLRRLREIARDDGMLLIGFDLKKDESVLRRAYNDEEGVTAAFNKNLLVRINRELGGTFDPERFEHDARWVGERSRIESHLVSQDAQTVEVDGRTIEFDRGESIHTENSHKFDRNAMDEEAAAGGFRPIAQWEDERGWFRVALFAAE